jgi:hypothetical protein
MSGFSTTRSNIWGIDNISKQYGSILRGWGPPVPKAGVLGDLYIDNLTYQLFEKREVNDRDDWGHYLWVVPSQYRNSMKWFGPSGPANTLGRPGDFFLQWAGYDNYGMQLKIWGPKLVSGWPENGEGPGNTGTPVIAVSDVRSVGLMDSGPDAKDLSGTRLWAVGLMDEYIVPLSVTANPGEPVTPVGVPSTGQLVLLTTNPLYTVEDNHVV